MTDEEPTVHMAAEPWQSPATTELFRAVLELETVEEVASFFRDLCTLGELHDLAQRWAVVRLLDAGLHYAEISTLTGASTATITRIAQWLRYGQGGYRLILERTRSAGAVGGGTTPLPGAASTPSSPGSAEPPSAKLPLPAAPAPARPRSRTARPR